MKFEIKVTLGKIAFFFALPLSVWLSIKLDNDNPFIYELMFGGVVFASKNIQEMMKK